jgi:hypothetical protein
MLIGQTLLIPHTGSTIDYFGPWMPRQGDALTVVCEILKESNTGWEFSLYLETKNSEDRDSDLTNLTGGNPALAVTTTGTHQATASGCLELVRYRYAVSAESAGQDRWIHFRMNPPLWQPN